MGALVIGKTQTTQFAFGECSTADNVDKLAPFNPRGEGFQHPQGSSAGAGAGAGLSSYGCMDIATGSDTGGSVRLPAMANDLFVTDASLSLEGILLISSIFDTPRVFTGSSKLLQTMHKMWFPSKSYTSYPKRLVLPEELWPTVTQTSMPLFNAFILSLGAFLNANAFTINTNASFNTHANTTSGLSACIELSYSNITNFDQYQLRSIPTSINTNFDQYQLRSIPPSCSALQGAIPGQVRQVALLESSDPS